MSQAPEFDEVYKTQAEYAYNLAVRLSRDRSEADDVFQESFLRVFRFLPRYRGGSLRAWVRRITVNVFYSLRRKPAPLPLEEAAEPSDPNADPARLLAGAVGTGIEQALSSLADDHRTTLVLREIEQLSYQEISELLEIPVGTVRSRLARARSALRAALEAQQKEGPDGA